MSKHPRVNELTAQWDDDGATRGTAYLLLRDLAREIESALSAEQEARKKAEESNAELLMAFNRAMGGETHTGDPAIQNDFKDAYVGAREDLLLWKKRAEAAEDRIKASREQEPVGYVRIYKGFGQKGRPYLYTNANGNKVLASGEIDCVYAQPPILPEVAELQRQLEEARKVPEGFQATFDCGQQSVQVVFDTKANADKYKAMLSAAPTTGQPKE